MFNDELQIDKFLLKLKLTKYRDKFMNQGPLYVKCIHDFSRFLQDPNILREAGMTVFEMNRFERLCEGTIKDFQSILRPNSEVRSSEDFFNQKIKKPVVQTPEIPTRNKIRLRYKILTKDSIIRNSSSHFTVATSVLYYQLVDMFSKSFSCETVGKHSQSVELYSNTGYPLAISPKLYTQPLSEWCLEENGLIFVYPKRMTSHEFKQRITSINIPIENTEVTIRVNLHEWSLFYCDLKILISQQLHLHTEAIVVKMIQVETNKLTIPEDRYKLDIEDIQRDVVRLSIQISDTWGDGSYLGAFASSLYTSCTDQIMCDWHHFNAVLLFLAKEQSEISRDKLLEKLGLIRKLSCSPPLVYALYRLFTGLQIALPHRVAINEGILTSLSLILPSEDPPQIHKFYNLWIHVERNSSPDHKNTEIFENNYISKSIRANPKNIETKRLLHVFPESENTIVTWKDCPSAHEPFNYKTHALYFPQDKINQRFPLKHPIEIYQQFINNNTKYGLVRALVHNLNSPTVFLGPTTGRYGNFDFYSPEKGKCESYNPHDVTTSNKCCIDYTTHPSTIIIILDISADMSFGCEEYEHGREQNEPNIVISCLDMGIILIELLIDSITGLGCRYLIEIILISNDHDHDFPNGFYTIQEPTFEYAASVNKVRKCGENYKLHKSIFRRLPDGIIINVLNHLLRKYPRNMGQEIFIFTTHDHRKFYGSKRDSVMANLRQKQFKTNFNILSDKSSRIMCNVSAMTKGIYVDTSLITTNRPYQSSPHFPQTLNEIHSHYIIEYHSFMQDKQYLDNKYYGSYNNITSEIKMMVSIESLLSRTQGEKDSYSCFPNSIYILKQISNYSKNPNPFCKLFCVHDQIQTLISIIQGPDNTPYANSVLFLEIQFGQNFPQKPPRFRFLSSYYHPNIRVSGELCHPILFEDYHPDISLRQIMDAIYSMLYTPVISHAVRYKVLEIALFYKDLYNKLVRSFIKLFSFDTTMSDSLKSLNIDESFKKVHPKPYICPLTKELFDLPVMTPEGNTYERHAILQHLKFSQTDPITKAPLTQSDLIPNNPVMSAVYKYRKKFCAKNYWWD